MDVKHRGWMHKEGGSYKSWKHRYFILEHQELRYYKDEKEATNPSKKPLGVILVQGSSVLNLDRGERDKPYAFKIVPSSQHESAQRTFYLNCDNMRARAEWMVILQQASGVNHAMLDENNDVGLQRSNAMEEWILKKGGKRASGPFKKRWVYMDGDSLKWFVNKNDEKPKGEFSLMGARVVDSSAQTLEWHVKEEDRMHVFKVENGELYTMWLEAMQKHIERLNGLIKKAQNFWTMRNIYLPFQRWRNILNMRGLDVLMMDGLNLSMYAKKKFAQRVTDAAPSKTGENKHYLYDYDNANGDVVKEKETAAASPTPQETKYVYDYVELGVTVTLSVELLNVVPISWTRFDRHSLKEVFLRELIAARYPSARVSGGASVLEQSNEHDLALQHCVAFHVVSTTASMEVALFTRSFLPPNADSEALYLIIYSKDTPSADMDALRNDITTMVGTVQPITKIADTEYTGSFPQLSNPVVLASDYLDWYDVVMDRVPESFDAVAANVNAFYRLCFTQKLPTPIQFTPEQTALAAAYIDGGLLGDRFTFEHVAKGMRKAMFQGHEDVRAQIHSIVAQLVGASHAAAGAFTSDALLDAFRNGHANELVLARLLDVHYFDVVLPADELVSCVSLMAREAKSMHLRAAVLLQMAFMVNLDGQNCGKLLSALDSQTHERLFFTVPSRGTHEKEVEEKIRAETTLSDVFVEEANPMDESSSPTAVQAPVSGLESVLLTCWLRFHTVAAPFYDEEFGSQVVKTLTSSPRISLSDRYTLLALANVPSEVRVHVCVKVVDIIETRLGDDDVMEGAFLLLYKEAFKESGRKPIIKTFLTKKNLLISMSTRLKSQMRDETRRAMIGFLYVLALEYGEKMGKVSDVLTALGETLIKSIDPQTMLMATGALLAMAQFNGVLEKMQSVPEIAVGARRAKRFRRSEELVRFASYLESRVTKKH